MKTALCFTACRKRWDAYGYSANMMIRTALESGAADDSQIGLLCRSGFECVLG